MKTIFRNSIMMAFVAGSFTMYSCRETNKEEPAEPMQHEMREGEEMDHDGATSMSEEEILNDEITAEFEDDRIASVYQHYINIKNALVKTDATAAQDMAKAMVADLENSEANEALATAAREISTSNDVNQQREAFSGLTKAMETELEGAIASGEIYKQYCPMANDNKGGYWLASEKKIRNPFYGSKMMSCGSVEEEIK